MRCSSVQAAEQKLKTSTSCPLCSRKRTNSGHLGMSALCQRRTLVLPGVHTVHVRHEHSTVAAATAYNVATGKVAVASVTCGPGVTQLMTAMPAAGRARLPMVVFAANALQGN